MKINLGWDKIDWEQLSKNHYEDEISNLNNYSYWYPKVKDCGIKMVDSRIYKIPYDMWKNFNDIENHESEKKCIQWIKKTLEDDKDLIPYRIYNIKNGTFSNKFNANDCIVHYAKIPEKFLNIQYVSQCYETGGTTELVIRENIDYDNQKVPTIYDGLPLRTEFRVFVDFDKEEVLYIVNYWDYDYCYKHLCLTDKIIFDYMKERLEADYEKNKDYVINLIKEKLIPHNKKLKDRLTGKWSVDIMKSEKTYYLIDMAIAEQSAYWKPYASNNKGE